MFLLQRRIDDRADKVGLVPPERQHDILEQLDALFPIPLVVSLIDGNDVLPLIRLNKIIHDPARFDFHLCNPPRLSCVIR